jgi:HPt (histidine-containing phosphotransfer) domain-containing protein
MCLHVSAEDDDTHGQVSIQDAAIVIGVLESLIGNDPIAIASVLDTYLCSVNVSAAQLREAIGERSRDRVAALAHRVKSPSLSIGALALSAICVRIEAAIETDDWSAIESLSDAFQASFAAVAAECRPRLNLRSSDSSNG